MVRILDSRTSLGSDGSDPMNIPLPHNTPTLIGIVGLNIAHPGSMIRVQFSGTIHVSVPNLISIPSYVRLQVYRGSSNEGQAIYAVSHPVDIIDRFVLASFDGSDYDVPAPASGQLVYSCYATYIPGLFQNDAFRLGPESFNAVAYCDG